jgi:DNA-binding transcriptional MocR family regulator
LEDYEEYLKRPQQTVVVARATVNQQTVNDFLLWEDVDKWLEEIRSKLEHDL